MKTPRLRHVLVTLVTLVTMLGFSVPAGAQPSEKELVLIKLWDVYQASFNYADSVIGLFKDHNPGYPHVNLVDDPKVREKLKLAYRQRFIRAASESLTLEEAKYLVQLNSTSLMKRSYDIDTATWNKGEIRDLTFKVLEEAASASKAPPPKAAVPTPAPAKAAAPVARPAAPGAVSTPVRK